MHYVWGNPDQITLTNFSFLIRDLHDAASRNDVVELMSGMRVCVDEPSAGNFPLTDKLKESTLGHVLELARLKEPPDRHGSCVFDNRGYIPGGADIHFTLPRIEAAEVERLRQSINFSRPGERLGLRGAE
jgi:hypothetical protein